jgi:ubiquinone/menaquinone biosynthesis C-methylase UbiE
MAIDEQRLNDFVTKAVGDLSAGYSGIMVSIGDKLGLYKAMAGAGPLSSAELARRTGCAERYVREWLNAQVAGGYVDYHSVSGSYELPPENAVVLADTSSPVFIPPAWQIPASVWFDEERSLRAFRTGEGVPWGEHNHRLYCGVAAFYRNAYRGSLVPEWLPALDGVVDRLKAGAKVADVGCGHGHSTILMAEAFPKSTFWAFDTHEESIVAARENAAEAGVADRITFEVAKADSYENRGYDLICFFDCLHDLGWPVDAAAHAARSLSPDGTVTLVEPFAHDRLEDNTGPIARLYYTGSTLLCCQHAISEKGSHVLGAQAGEARLAEIFRKAGFTRFRRAMETPFNMILEARV